MRIVRGTESITVDHPVFLIFGQPGIGKSSLGYSADKPLLLDFDAGAHRAVNRRDTLLITSWDDVEELMEQPDVLDPYATVIPDTVGRCLDLITADIARNDPKKAPGGNLSQQGWGTLKSRFRTWTSQLRALGKDVLLIAHDKEERDGDLRIVRPDIAGGSYGEVLKIADFVGYLSMNGKDRVLDFNPTDRWVGKNPAGWQPLRVPPVGKAGTFMADLIARGREALGHISDESAAVLALVDGYRTRVDAMTTAGDINAEIASLRATTLPHIVEAQVKKHIVDRAKVLGLTWDKATAAFIAPTVAADKVEA